MIPPAFDYAAPATLEEAIRLLQEHGDEAKLLAGGHSLIPLMKLRLAAPTFLVDLARIPHLSYVREHENYVAIGAMTRHYDLETSQVLLRTVPLLAQAASTVGDMQVRNRGTIGGSVAHADPASDLPTVVTALDAVIVARGPEGDREIAAGDFFLDIWTSVLRPDEIITEIRVPLSHTAPAQAYEKFRLRASDWAIVGVAVNAQRNGDGLERASIVLTNVGTTPIHASSVESALLDGPLTPDSLRAAAELASENLSPSPELRATPDYKRHLARVLTRRALEAALKLN